MAPSQPYEPTVSSSSPLPTGYVFVPKGNIYITKTCRKLTQDAHRRIYVVQNANKAPLGIRVPAAIYNQVLDLEKRTRTARAAAVTKKDQSLETKTRAVLSRCFPQLPAEKVPVILKHTLAKRSGRVGRATDLPLSKVVTLAVRAHVRHRCTEYEAMLRRGKSRQQARKDVQGSVDEMVRRWAGKVDRPRAARSMSVAETWNKQGEKQNPKNRKKANGSQIQQGRVRKCKASGRRSKTKAKKSAAPPRSGRVDRPAKKMSDSAKPKRAVLTHRLRSSKLEDRMSPGTEGTRASHLHKSNPQVLLHTIVISSSDDEDADDDYYDSGSDLDSEI